MDTTKKEIRVSTVKNCEKCRYKNQVTLLAGNIQAPYSCALNQVERFYKKEEVMFEDCLLREHDVIVKLLE